MNTPFTPFISNEPTIPARVAVIRALIKDWINSPWFIDLLNLYEGNITLEGRLDNDLAQLEEFSDRWDFRRIARERGAATDDNLTQGAGSARWLSANTGFSPEVETRILDDSLHLGLVQAQEPVLQGYDYVLVLGGARLSCMLRSVRAAEIVRSGVQVNNIALLGAARPVAESERDATDTYAPNAVDEFDLIIAGARDAFGIDTNVYQEDRYDDPNNKNLSWAIRTFHAEFEKKTYRFLAISAPSSDPLSRRANSADTWTFFLDQEKPKPGNKLLLVTSQIYVPYVQLEALRTLGLPHNLLVETIGFPGDRMPQLQGLTNANHYLQEIRSTIQAALRFCRAYPE